MSSVELWLRSDERVRVAAGVLTPRAVAYRAYRSWCRDRGTVPLAVGPFFTALEAYGIRRAREGRTWCVEGVAVSGIEMTSYDLYRVGERLDGASKGQSSIRAGVGIGDDPLQPDDGVLRVRRRLIGKFMGLHRAVLLIGHVLHLAGAIGVVVALWRRR